MDNNANCSTLKCLVHWEWLELFRRIGNKIQSSSVYLKCEWFPIIYYTPELIEQANIVDFKQHNTYPLHNILKRILFGYSLREYLKASYCAPSSQNEHYRKKIETSVQTKYMSESIHLTGNLTVTGVKVSIKEAGDEFITITHLVRIKRDSE